MRAGAAAWIALAAAFAVAAALCWSAAPAALDWRPALTAAEPWRMWTAAFVHLSPLHLLANELGCLVVAAFGAVARVPVAAAWAWFMAWPLGHAALALQPALTSYGGLSGVLHAGVAVVAWQLLRRDHGTRRSIGAAVLVGLVVKLVLERPWESPTRSMPGWDFAVAPLAHATGSAAGLACALIVDLVAARMGRRP